MRRVMSWMVLALASGVVGAQEPEGGLPRVVVLPTNGNCARPQKQLLQSAGESAVAQLDQARFQALDMNTLAAEVMALGEDGAACTSDKCWLDLLARLNVSFAVRSECIDVAGTGYVTSRFFNSKSGAVMAEDDCQTAPNSMSVAEGHLRHLVGRALEVPLDVPVAVLQPDPLGAKVSGPKVAVFVCESPLGMAHSPDYPGTTATARAVIRWLRAHRYSDVETPAVFRVPASSLGRECELDSIRAKELAAKSGAATVVWLRAKDEVASTVDSAGREVQGYKASFSARAYHATIGRYGKLITGRSAFCERAVLASRACGDAFASSVDAVMAGWAESLKANPADF